MGLRPRIRGIPFRNTPGNPSILAPFSNTHTHTHTHHTLTPTNRAGTVLQPSAESGAHTHTHTHRLFSNPCPTQRACTIPHQARKRSLPQMLRRIPARPGQPLQAVTLASHFSYSFGYASYFSCPAQSLRPRSRGRLDQIPEL